jgi:hypothetical protein
MPRIVEEYDSFPDLGQGAIFSALRNSVCVTPTTFRKTFAKWLGFETPTSIPISMTLREVSRMSCCARVIRSRVTNYSGDMPVVCLKTREKWKGLSSTSAASASTQMSSARCSDAG